jgi:hypothetical protein
MSPKVQSRQNGLDRGSDYNFNNFSQGNSTIGFNDAANSSQNILVIQTHKGAATDQKNLNKSRQQNQVRELKSRKHWERKNNAPLPRRKSFLSDHGKLGGGDKDENENNKDGAKYSASASDNDFAFLQKSGGVSNVKSRKASAIDSVVN